MEHIQLIFVLLLVCTAFVVSLPHPAIPCIATELVDTNLEEDWDFRIPFWENFTVSFATAAQNILPMTGIYTYEYSFCNSMYVYIGDHPGNSGFGWSYGSMLAFDGYNVVPDIPPAPPSAPSVVPPDDHIYRAYKVFSQIFVDGDAGAPCTADIGREATIDIYCGLSKANCTQVPPYTGANCLNTNSTISTDGFCLCSIQYNSTFGICRGLTISLLSNKCPPSRVKPIITPPPPFLEEGSRAVGIAFAVLAVFIFVAMLGGYVYNISVHAKRGCQAVPFYDTCTGRKDPTNYTGQPDQPAVVSLTPVSKPLPGGYGSI